jgi:Cu/Ag efflux pump CusA
LAAAWTSRSRRDDLELHDLPTAVAVHTQWGRRRGVAAAFLSGGVLSLGSPVRFVTVLGSAARNSIMLVSHYRHLEDVEGRAFGPELLERGAQERLTPILMTALATGLALVPIVVGGS